jgi:hypothetical protein
MPHPFFFISPESFQGDFFFLEAMAAVWTVDHVPPHFGDDPSGYSDL